MSHRLDSSVTIKLKASINDTHNVLPIKLEPIHSNTNNSKSNNHQISPAHSAWYCDLCAKTFHSKHDLAVDIAKHYKYQTCKDCHQHYLVPLNPSDFHKQCYETHRFITEYYANNKLKCQHRNCGFITIIQKDFDQHFQTHKISKKPVQIKAEGNNKYLQCQKCAFKTQSQTELTNHYSVIHLSQYSAVDNVSFKIYDLTSDEPIKKTKKKSRGFFGQTNNANKSVPNLVSIDNGNVCQICQDTFSDKQRALLDWDRHSREYCKVCKLSYGQSITAAQRRAMDRCLSKHEYILEKLRGFKQFKCEHCPFTTVIRNNFEYHKAIHSNNPLSMNSTNKISNQAMNTCVAVESGKELFDILQKKQQNMTKKRVITPIAIVPPRPVRKPLSSKKIHKTPIKTVPKPSTQNPKEYYCYECKKQFQNGRAFGGHKSRLHSAVRRYNNSPKPKSVSTEANEHNCHDCGRHFHSGAALGGHRSKGSCLKPRKKAKIRKSPKNKDHLCEDCDTYFKSGSSLGGHRSRGCSTKRHKQEKKAQIKLHCRVCDITHKTEYLALEDFDMHSRVKCRVCNIPFGAKIMHAQYNGNCYAKHQFITSQLSNPKFTQLHCKYCAYITIFQTDYDAHLITHKDKIEKIARIQSEQSKINNDYMLIDSDSDAQSNLSSIPCLEPTDDTHSKSDRNRKRTSKELSIEQRRVLIHCNHIRHGSSDKQCGVHRVHRLNSNLNHSQHKCLAYETPKTITRTIGGKSGSCKLCDHSRACTRECTAKERELYTEYTAKGLRQPQTTSISPPPKAKGTKTKTRVKTERKCTDLLKDFGTRMTRSQRKQLSKILNEGKEGSDSDSDSDSDSEGSDSDSDETDESDTEESDESMNEMSEFEYSQESEDESQELYENMCQLLTDKESDDSDSDSPKPKPKPRRKSITPSNVPKIPKISKKKAHAYTIPQMPKIPIISVDKSEKIPQRINAPITPPKLKPKLDLTPKRKLKAKVSKMRIPKRTHPAPVRRKHKLKPIMKVRERRIKRCISEPIIDKHKHKSKPKSKPKRKHIISKPKSRAKPKPMIEERKHKRKSKSKPRKKSLERRIEPIIEKHKSKPKQKQKRPSKPIIEEKKHKHKSKPKSKRKLKSTPKPIMEARAEEPIIEDMPPEDLIMPIPYCMRDRKRRWDDSGQMQPVQPPNKRQRVMMTLQAPTANTIEYNNYSNVPHS